MSITLNTLAYAQDSFQTPNKVLYVGPSHTFQLTDTLALSRVAPKPTSTFAGVARSEAKRTKTLTLADGSKADCIISVSASVPVGAAQADVDALRDDIGDFTISADGGTLIWKHDLTY